MLYRKIYIWILGILSIGALAFVFYSEKYSIEVPFANRQKEFADKISNRIGEKEREIYNIIKENGLQNSSTLPEFNKENIELIEKKEFHLNVFERDSLVFWSYNKICPDSLIN